MKHLDLFSGIGGFAYAAQQVWGSDYECVGFVEIDPYCQAVLKKRFPGVPIYGDIRQVTADSRYEDAQGYLYKSCCGENERIQFKSQNTANREICRQVTADSKCLGWKEGARKGMESKEQIPKGQDIRNTVPKGIHLITGGFPCQPFSQAGRRKGTTDNRYLWPEMLRVISEVRPRWVIGENVSGIWNMVLNQVCIDLEAQGYDVTPFIIPACAVNAPHRRDRVWIVAYTSDTGCDMRLEGNRNRNGNNITMQYRGTNWEQNWLEVATCLCRVDDGISARMDGLELSKSRHRVERLKALGNAIVPQVVMQIMQAIKENDDGTDRRGNQKAIRVDEPDVCDAESNKEEQ